MLLWGSNLLGATGVGFNRTPGSFVVASSQGIWRRRPEWGYKRSHHGHDAKFDVHDGAEFCRAVSFRSVQAFIAALIPDRTRSLEKLQS